jgi:outer membrane protein assembly factor BamE (lipoprotein component of BamABCDE complex)
MKIIQVAALLFVITLSGCDYSSGTNVSSDQAKQFTVGTSTMSQVEAKLGMPTDTTSNSDGTQTLTYQYNNTHQDALNYVPVVGLVHSHVEQTSNKTTFIFSQAGILQSYSTGSGSSGLANH